MVYSGVDFNMKEYEEGEGPEFSRDVWFGEKFKLGLSFPNLPYFVDGTYKLTESIPIHVYIADKWDPALLGTTPKERATVNQLGNILDSLKMGVTMPCYMSGDRGEAIQAMNKDLPGLLKARGAKKFLVSDKPTWIDFHFFELVQLMAFVEPNLFKLFPELESYDKAVRNLPRLKNYLEDPNCLEKHRSFHNKRAPLNNLDQI
mmetsp:Transcript_493/g.967  ORF Transcript_493/g.967 Transcript_493/m.967 type:complete len:203 (+) Transcript_493:725-1333(+)